MAECERFLVHRAGTGLLSYEEPPVYPTAEAAPVYVEQPYYVEEPLGRRQLYIFVGYLIWCQFLYILIVCSE